MDRTDEDEHAYFLKRRDDHRTLARRCEDASQRALHERFADLYAERAASIGVDDH
ncbi:hypothetical protein [Sphingomonas sp. Y38-1Y]|uniref:hypothetical protein n=1 Tax=Sphingomonas sp. Y38-1Y TaxID=3078265 RepID=UPI0028F12DDD|nr:hypothetical protein [Sphingomonas sp. Y38-1Y]